MKVACRQEQQVTENNFFEVGWRVLESDTAIDWIALTAQSAMDILSLHMAANYSRRLYIDSLITERLQINTFIIQDACK